MTTPIYLPFGSFTAVGTPHALDQAINRTGSPLVEFLDAQEVDLPTLYETLTPDQCHWIPVHNFLLYVKRKYNHRRRRNELELISLTPNNHAITHARKFAKPVEALKASDNAFSAFVDSYDSDDDE